MCVIEPLEPRLQLTVAVNDIRLANATGISDSDRLTSDPSLEGQVTWSGEESYGAIEFDHDNDGLVDGYADVFTSGELFHYDPRDFDPIITDTAGQYDFSYRAIEYDLNTGSSISASPWSAFSFSVEPPIGSVTVAVTGSSAIEGEDVAFTISLSDPAPQDIDISFWTQDGTAIGGTSAPADFQETIGDVFFAVGEQTKTVSIATFRDLDFDGDEIFELVFSSSEFGGYSATGTILEGTTDTQTISAESVALSEGSGGNVSFTLSEPAFAGQALDYVFQDGSAVADSDYSGFSGTHLFAGGETVFTVDFATIDDARYESDESFFVSAGEAIATVTILDNDGPDSNLLALISDATVAEGDTATLTVHLEEPSSEAVVLDLEFTDLTATMYEDYEPFQTTVQFPAGATTASIDLPTYEDEDYEQSAFETLKVDVGAWYETDGEQEFYSLDSSTVTILEDDLPDIEIVGFSANGEDLVIQYHVDDYDVLPFAVTIYRVAEADLTSFGSPLVNGTIDVSAGTPVISHTLTEPSYRWTTRNPLLGPEYDGAPHELSLPVSFADIPEDYFLVAVVNSTSAADEVTLTNNTLAFGGGVFRTADGIVHVHGNAAGANESTIVSAAADLSVVHQGNSYSYPLDTPSVRVRAHGGDDTVIMDNAVAVDVWVFGGDGSDQISAGIGDDLVDGGDGADNITAGDGNDRVFGGSGHDRIHGGFGSDTLTGGSGDDWLFGEADMDSLDGGDGNDVYSFVGASDLGSDTITETVDGGVDTLHFAYFDGPVSVDLGDTSWQVVAPDQLNLQLSNGHSVETVVNSAVGDTAENTFRVPGTIGESIPLAFTFSHAITGAHEEIAVFTVDDSLGRIDGLLPSDAGYAAAAAARKQNLFSANASSAAIAVASFPADSYISLMVTNRSGDVFFAFPQANPSSFDHFRSVTPRTGLSQFAIETSRDGGDADYDDVILTVGRLPRIQIADATIVEPNTGSEDAVFDITMDAISATRVDIPIGTQDGTAMAADGDYEATTRILTFYPGELATDFAVPVYGDSRDEFEESFSVRMTDPANGLLVDDTGIGVIQDNDEPPTLSVSDIDVVEGNFGTSFADFSVTLSGTSGKPISVDFSTVGDSAIDVRDYSAVAGTLQFAPGQTQATISVPIFGNVRDEPDRQFHLQLSHPSNVTLSQTQASATIIDDDAMPVLAIANSQAVESDATATPLSFLATLSHPSAFPISVNYVTSDGTANAGSDYSQSSGTLTFAADELAKSITVDVLGDRVDEHDEHFDLTFSGVQNATLSRTQATGTALDNDQPPTLSIDDLTVTEDVGMAILTVSLSDASGKTVSASFRTLDGTALYSKDYSPIAPTALVFAPGTTSQTIGVPIADDLLNESDETLSVMLTSSANATIADGSGTITITDNDELPSLSISDTSVDQEAGQATFTVDLSAASGRDIAVTYATLDGTATAGVDYTQISNNSLIIPKGKTSSTIEVDILEDAADEANETFLVELFSADFATLDDSIGQATIVDDDASAVLNIADVAADEASGSMSFVVTLAGETERTVTVAYVTNDDTAIGTADYETIASGVLTFSPGVTSRTITVPIIDDTIDEPEELFRVVFSDPINAALATTYATGAITDNDAPPNISVNNVAVGEGAGQAIVNVSLSAASEKPIEVSLVSSNGSAESPVDYSSINGITRTLAPGTTELPIAIPIIDDPLDEETETFTVTLTSAANAIIADATGIVSITDNDALPTIAINDVTVDPETGQAAFTISLSSVSGRDVDVSYTTVDGTAAAGSDFTADINGAITIAKGSSNASIFVDILEDALDEANETFLVELLSADHAILADVTGQATIIDDDAAPVLNITDSVANEAENQITFNVTLIGHTEQTVRVSYAIADGTATFDKDYSSADPTILTFPPGTASRTITVPIIEDDVDEHDETIHVTLSEPENAAIVKAQATGTITDNDPFPSLFVDDIVVDEDVGNASLTVSLSSPSEKLIEVTYTTKDGTAQVSEDYSAAGATSLSFEPGTTARTINIPINDDALDEYNEYFTVSLVSAQNATISVDAATISINDNDTPPTVSIGDISLAPETGTANFRVSLSEISGRDISFTFATADGTATEGADYRAIANGNLMIAKGAVDAPIAVEIFDDAVDELDETFLLNLLTADHATFVKDTAQATIIDDDAAPELSIADVSANEADGALTFTVNLDGLTEKSVTVGYSIDEGTATFDADLPTTPSAVLTFPPGTTSHTITVPITDDLLDEHDETFNVVLTSPTNASLKNSIATGIIVDDDASPVISIADVVVDPESAQAVFTVSLSAVSGRDISFTCSTADGTATAGSDYVAIIDGGQTIPAGTTNAAIAVAINEDAIDEEDETFLVNLQSVSYAELGDGTGQATIVDNDELATLSVSDLVVDEAAGVVSVDVTLTGATEKTVAVTYGTADGTAIGGADYATVGSTTLTFAPGITSRAISVPVLDDSIDELNETFTISLSDPINANVTAPQAIVAISDDDDAPDISIADVTALEGDLDATAVYVLVGLSRPSGLPVAFDYITIDDTAKSANGDYVHASGSITMPAGNTRVIIPVEIAANAIDQPDREFFLKLEHVTNAAQTELTSTVTVLDDDDPPLVYVTGDVVNENDPSPLQSEFTVSLTSPSDFPISMHYRTIGAKAKPNEDFVDEFGSLTFEPGETEKKVAVDIVDDPNYEGYESFLLEISDVSSDLVRIAQSTGVTAILDDDPPPTLTIDHIGEIAEIGQAVFTVRQSSLSAFDTHISFATASSGATGGLDYYPFTQGHAIIPAGDRNVTISVPINADHIHEPDEDFYLLLLDAENATIGDTERRTIIIDDDPADLEKQVKYTLRTTDAEGVLFPNATIGDTIYLQVNVTNLDDFLRPVSGAYLDIAYDQTSLSPLGAPEFGFGYTMSQNYDTTRAGLVDNIGAFAPEHNYGLLFRMPFLVTGPNPFDIDLMPAGSGNLFDTFMQYATTPVQADRLAFEVLTGASSPAGEFVDSDSTDFDDQTNYPEPDEIPMSNPIDDGNVTDGPVKTPSPVPSPCLDEPMIRLTVDDGEIWEPKSANRTFTKFRISGTSCHSIAGVSLAAWGSGGEELSSRNGHYDGFSIVIDGDLSPENFALVRDSAGNIADVTGFLVARPDTDYLDEHIKLKLDVPGNSFPAIGTEQRVTINDTSVPAPEFRVEVIDDVAVEPYNGECPQPGHNARLKVSVINWPSNAPPAVVSLGAAGAAEAGLDYHLVPVDSRDTLTTNQNSLYQWTLELDGNFALLDIVPHADSAPVDEGNEVFLFSLFPPSGSLVNYVDNDGDIRDPAVPDQHYSVSLRANSDFVFEGNQTTLTVETATCSSRPFSVTLTPASTDDYYLGNQQSTSITVDFPPGGGRQFVPFHARSDTIPEGSETVRIKAAISHLPEISAATDVIILDDTAVFYIETLDRFAQIPPPENQCHVPDEGLLRVGVDNWTATEDPIVLLQPTENSDSTTYELELVDSSAGTLTYDALTNEWQLSIAGIGTSRDVLVRVSAKPTTDTGTRSASVMIATENGAIHPRKRFGSVSMSTVKSSDFGLYAFIQTEAFEPSDGRHKNPGTLNFHWFNAGPGVHATLYVNTNPPTVDTANPRASYPQDYRIIHYGNEAGVLQDQVVQLVDDNNDGIFSFHIGELEQRGSHTDWFQIFPEWDDLTEGTEDIVAWIEIDLPGNHSGTTLCASTPEVTIPIHDNIESMPPHDATIQTDYRPDPDAASSIAASEQVADGLSVELQDGSLRYSPASPLPYMPIYMSDGTHSNRTVVRGELTRPKDGWPSDIRVHVEVKAEDDQWISSDEFSLLPSVRTGGQIAFSVPLDLDPETFPTGVYDMRLLARDLETGFIEWEAYDTVLINNLRHDNPIAPGWTMPFLDRLVAADVRDVTGVQQSGVALFRGDNSVSFFASDGDGFQRPAESLSELTMKNGDYRLTHRYGNYDIFFGPNRHGPEGYLWKSVDRNGNETVFAYDANNRLQSVIDPFYRGTTYAYDQGPTQNHTRITDFAGRETSFVYDRTAYRLTITHPDPDGALSQTAPVEFIQYYDDQFAAHNEAIKSVVRTEVGSQSEAHKTSIELNPWGRVAEVKVHQKGTVDAIPDAALTTWELKDYRQYEALPDPATNSWSRTGNILYEYRNGLASFQNRVETHDGRDLSRKYVLEHRGRVLQFEPVLVGVYTNLITSADPYITTVIGDNDRGEVREYREPDPDGPGPLTQLVTKYRYNARTGDLEQQTPPALADTAVAPLKFKDHVLGKPRVTINELGHQTVYEIDASGNIGKVTQVDPSGGDTVWQNPFDRLDVNGDLVISPMDVYPVIAYTNLPVDNRVPPVDLNPGPYYDVNGDGVVAAADVNMLSNFLNVHGITAARHLPNATDSVVENYYTGDARYESELPTGHQAAYLPEGLIGLEIVHTGRDVNDDNVIDEQDAIKTLYEYYDFAGNPHEFGQVKTITSGFGTSLASVVAYSYDLNGNVNSVTTQIDDGRYATAVNEYDSLNRLTRAVSPDPDGSGPQQPLQTTFHYDAFSNVVRQTTTNTTYDYTSGVATDPQNFNLSQCNYYDGLNRVEWVVQTPGNECVEPSEANPDAPTFRSHYDANSNLVKSVDPVGRTTGYRYDFLDRLDEIILPNPLESGELPNADNSNLNRHKSFGEVGGPITKFTYYGNGLLRTTTDPEKNVTEFTYDAWGRQIQTEQPAPYDDAPDDKAISTTKFVPSYTGWAEQLTDPRGNTTTTTFDFMGRVATIIAPQPFADDDTVHQAFQHAAPVMGYEYYADGLLKQLHQPAPTTGNEQVTTTYDYDAKGRLRQITEPATADHGSPVTQYTYYDNDAIKTTTDTLNRVSTNHYDDAGRLTEVKLPPSSSNDSMPTLQYFHDAVGNVLFEKDVYDMYTLKTFDAYHRLETHTLPQPLNVTWDEIPKTFNKFNVNGTVQYAKDVHGYLQDFVYDRHDRIVKRYETRNITDGITATPFTEFTYYAAGDIATITTPNDDTTTFTYDHLHRLSEESVMIDGDEFSRTFRYEKNGNLQQRTDRLGRRIEYQYDALNRQYEERWFDPDGNANGYVAQFKSYADGSMREAWDDRDYTKLTSYSLNYDELGRVDVLNVELPVAMAGRQFEYDYSHDKAGRITSRNVKHVDGIATQDLFTTVYQFDGLNRLSWLAESGNGALEKAIEFVYARFDSSTPDAGRLTDIYRFELADHGLAPEDAIASTHIDYYGLNDTLVAGDRRRTKQISHGGALINGNQNFETTYSYSYTAGGRMARMAASKDGNPLAGEDLNFAEYDSSGRVLQIQDDAGSVQNGFAYDNSGNRLGDIDPHNRLRQDAANRLEYDDEGNVVVRWQLADKFSLVKTLENTSGNTIQKYSDEHQINQTGWYRLRLNPVKVETEAGNLGRVRVDVGVWNNDFAFHTELSRSTYIETLSDTAEDGVYVLEPKMFDFFTDQAYSNAYAWIQLTFLDFPATNPRIETDIELYVDQYVEVQEFTWDHNNRLIAITDRSRPAVHSDTSATRPMLADTHELGAYRYRYDVLGNLFHKQRFSNAAAAGAAPLYVPEQSSTIVTENGKPLLEFGSDGRLERQRLYAHAIDKLIAIEDFDFDSTGSMISDELIWTLTDPQGTVRDLWSTVANRGHEHLQFDAFGVRSDAPDMWLGTDDLLSDAVTAGFRGMDYDSEFDFYLAGNRPYDPASGRLMNTDPMAESVGANPYVFAGNSPANRSGKSRGGRSAGSAFNNSNWSTYTRYVDFRNDFADARDAWNNGDYLQTAESSWFGASKVAGWTMFVVGTAGAGAEAAGGVGAAVGGITASGAATYAAKTTVTAGMSTMAEAGIAAMTGDDSFHPGWAFVRNFAVDGAIGWIPGLAESKTGGRAARYAAHFAREVALSTSADTAWSVAVEGRDFSDSLTQSFVGNILGQGVGDVLSSGIRRAMPRVAAGSPGRLCFAAGTLVQLATNARERSRFEAIERLELGQRVQTDHSVDPTILDNNLDPATLRVVELQPLAPEDADVRIRLLRSLNWLAAVGAEPGQSIHLDIPELRLSGEARVLSITASPPIQSGDGAVITGIFRHVANELVSVSVSGQSAPIRSTPRHPYWSNARQQFVAASDLQIGEQLNSNTGEPVTVTSVTSTPHPETVYNIEVHVEHAYRVTTHGLLVHNASVDPNEGKSAKTLVLGEGMPAVQDAVRRLRSLGVNAKWYQAWSKNFPTNRPLTQTEREAALACNERWIRKKVKEGYQFYDIGLDPTRSVPSPFYALEQRILKELGVQTIPLPR